ncbi:MAG: hypothetical protein KGQ37_10980 [Hyphomicrobiales bacterium]|nr:hypothetical protein [Hyphomicrobiales bacterium]
MKKALLLLVALATIYATGIEGAMAGMAAGASASDMQVSGSIIHKARYYCVNRYTGRFLYWGRCRVRHLYYHRHYHHYYYRHHYRVYCRTRYSHRFLHWGPC